MDLYFRLCTPDTRHWRNLCYPATNSIDNQQPKKSFCYSSPVYPGTILPLDKATQDIPLAVSQQTPNNLSTHGQRHMSDSLPPWQPSKGILPSYTGILLPCAKNRDFSVQGFHFLYRGILFFLSYPAKFFKSHNVSHQSRTAYLERTISVINLKIRAPNLPPCLAQTTRPLIHRIVTLLLLLPFCPFWRLLHFCHCSTLTLYLSILTICFAPEVASDYNYISNGNNSNNDNFCRY